MSTSDKINLSNNNPVNDFLREALLAIGLVLLILGSLWIATGQFPPMVVVESGSMMHDTEDGSLGAIDPGDLVLVMNPNRVNIVTYVEAMEEDNQNFGYTSHGMEGDVIIYSKNGGSDTPVIHRAILKLFQIILKKEKKLGMFWERL